MIYLYCSDAPVSHGLRFDGLPVAPRHLSCHIYILYTDTTCKGTFNRKCLTILAIILIDDRL